MSTLNKMTTKPEQAVYTLVVGLGKTGLSVVRYLRALGEIVVVADSRDIPPNLNVLKNDYSDVALYVGKFDVALFNNAHRIIVSPGVALTEPALIEARKNNVEIIGDIDLFADEVKVPVVGITGSNGKSTVTALLALMASQANLNSIASGNIGMPVLNSLDDDIDLYVLELSSFQLESLQCLPMKAAVVLNISADHLDRYENLAAYTVSKQAIYENAETLVLNKDDALASRVITHDTNNVVKQLYFTLGVPAKNEFGLCGDHLCFGSRKLIATNQLKVKGRHNLQNALAALTLGYATGLQFKDMLAALKAFKGLPHRTQFVATINDVDWINDSKATNVGATVAALTGLPGKHILIAGGIAKGADFSELAAVVKKHCRAVILLGEDAKKIQSVLPEGIVVKRVTDMQAAVIAAQKLAQSGDNVLLAPACASFDMFENFEQRGDIFMQAVEALKP
ncbi:UDP-N-acetylmuramoylalanine--D-glutamate ligase [hydrothermal vent metagenome]|uniref:UDP-N-acetylmuramoylalanine--D-glutamate ligase n=1 Tax=hydrothermal vent metagenome TaxID=652676 RepID=A0A3B0WLX8_9ZZZZ